MNTKIGIIGGGYWGKNLIRDFDKLSVLFKICDINEKSLDEYKIKYPYVKTTTSYDDLLNDDEVTAICIALPGNMHYEYGKKALNSNKDVYIEKPFTSTLEEAEELVKLSKEKNKILFIGHILNYNPYVKEIKNLISTKKFGNIISITANRFNLGIYRTDNNVLYDLAPHDISLVLSLCQNKLPNSVICNGHSYITNEIHDITNSILKYDDKYINVNVNWLNPYKEHRMTIICEKGMIVFDDSNLNEKLIYYNEYVSFNNTFPVVVNSSKNIIEIDDKRFPLEIECEAFIEACRSRNEPITNGEEGLRVMKVICALQDSLKYNKEILLNKENKENKEKYFAHETAIVDEGCDIGDNTKIWHFSHICKGAKIGKNCVIGQNVFIGGDAVIGDNCKVQNNVSIYNGIIAEDYVFFGPSCVLTNDYFPQCDKHEWNCKKTILKKGVSLCANSTIVCGVTINKHALIGAGAVVTKDVEEYSVMVGNPAKKIALTTDAKYI
jgi:UDP-2-acetamido-3-amino-2,3-dideoxy-glucuronate N-acetyltransferase